MRRYIFPVLMSLPIIFILTSVIYQKFHPRTNNANIITKSDFKQTETNWAEGEYTAISTNKDFLNRLANLPISENGVTLDERQHKFLRQTLINLVFGNFLGSYDDYLKFRVPTTNYVILQAAMDLQKDRYQNVFPDKKLPDSFTEADRQIWNHFFEGHPYWLGINLSNLEISLSSTNKIPYAFDFKVHHNYKTTASFGPVITSDLGFSFEPAIKNTLSTNGKVIVAQIAIMADTIDPPKNPRPFFYVLILDPEDHDIWLPVQLTHLTTKPVHTPGPF